MTSEIQNRETQSDARTEIDRDFDTMRRRFAESFGILPLGPFEFESGPRSPRTDVTDTGPSYRVVAEIPGIPKEKLDVRVRGATVEIRGECGTDLEEKDERYLHRERTFAGYYRVLELPEPVIGTDAKAKVVDGILELDLPKQNPTPSEEGVKVTIA
jgi:HSP20 family protein